MKTAISIPDEVFEEAEKTARKLGITRSELYARAVAEFIEVYGEREVTRRLDEIHGKLDAALDPVLARMQSSNLDEDGW